MHEKEDMKNPPEISLWVNRVLKFVASLIAVSIVTAIAYGAYKIAGDDEILFLVIVLGSFTREIYDHSMARDKLREAGIKP